MWPGINNGNQRVILIQEESENQSTVATNESTQMKSRMRNLFNLRLADS
jgi:hypothetical protein